VSRLKKEEEEEEDEEEEEEEDMYSSVINALSWSNCTKLYWKTGFWSPDRKGISFDSTVSRGLQTHRLTC
jgi:hypothetical protein